MDTKPPSGNEIIKTLGPYQFLKSLGKGGMGEVFLAYDKNCHRYVAFKQIREDLVKFQLIQDRFLREARLAASLTHPAIVPIYTIHIKQEAIYYTMPYIEGKTLKQLLREEKELEKNGEPQKETTSSLPSLIRIFVTICHAISYAHSKGILHRDIKPENVIIGKYGEVMILDWGLAQPMNAKPEEGIDLPYFEEENIELTKPGKIVGTLSYLAPERAFGEPSSISTDIYSLGVMLYQILTLQMPFTRSNLEHFKKNADKEKWVAPFEVAPYRDIPHSLERIARKCLFFHKNERYPTVKELIKDLDDYLEGRPEWIKVGILHFNEKNDWEVQENILLTKHIAITRSMDVMEWMSMMISKPSFSGNIKIEAKLRFQQGCSGLGILLGISSECDKKGFEKGYCLWIGSKGNPGFKLFRSNVEIVSIPDEVLQENTDYGIRIEKVDNDFRFYLDDVLKCSYSSYIPLLGTKIGLVHRDTDFTVEDFQVFVGGQNVMVNCLSIPDAFLAEKHYQKALFEYRRIGSSFPGRAEGREALFRAGITLLEWASSMKKKQERLIYLLLALEEFDKLHTTPGAPLEYLGKSLVYKTLKEIEEEIKCLELTLRKYPKHPLLGVVEEHVLFRLHEASCDNRKDAFHFALLSLRHLPKLFNNPDNARLIQNLSHYVEPLWFIEPIKHHESTVLTSALAFWLNKPITLVEMVENTPIDSPEAGGIIANCLFALIQLKKHTWALDLLHLINDLKIAHDPLDAILSHENTPILEKLLGYQKSRYNFHEFRAFRFFIETCLDEGLGKKVGEFLLNLPSKTFSQVQKEIIDELTLYALLQSKNLTDAKIVLKQFSQNTLNDEDHYAHFLQGCYIAATKGKKAGYEYFSLPSDQVYPTTTRLISSYLSDTIDLKKGWGESAFYWETIQLFRQLSLFYGCSGEKKRKNTV